MHSLGFDPDPETGNKYSLDSAHPVVPGQSTVADEREERGGTRKGEGLWWTAADCDFEGAYPAAEWVTGGGEGEAGPSGGTDQTIERVVG